MSELNRPIIESDFKLFTEMKEQRKKDIYYPKYHIAPDFGLLNDPNGLICVNGWHHIFYQWHPFSGEHGLKHWYHVKTKDYINFVDCKVGLYPQHEFDCNGCYSGNAYKMQGKVLLSYTGTVYPNNDITNRVSNQILVDYDLETNKINETLIVYNDDKYTGHARDPLLYKQNDKQLFIFGAQDKEKNGCLAIYEYIDNSLKYIKTLYNKNVKSYMWECPNVFKINNTEILLFSPQGIEKDNNGNFESLYNVVYTIFNKQEDVFEIDKGFDFYAPQTYLDENNKRVLLGWIGMGDQEIITTNNGWAHSLTIPRELSYENGYLIQKPYSKLKQLEKNSTIYTESFKLNSRSFKLQFKITADFNLKIGNHKRYFEFKRINDKFTIDRSTTNKISKSSYPELVNQRTRTFDSLVNEQEITIYVDSSTIEIFVNNGINTVTSNFYVKDLNDVMFTNINEVTYTNLKQINLYDNSYNIK